MCSQRAVLSLRALRAALVSSRNLVSPAGWSWLTVRATTVLLISVSLKLSMEPGQDITKRLLNQHCSQIFWGNHRSLVLSAVAFVFQY